ncbi:MAG: phosphoribosylformylglycinamidine synthase subunit PurL [Chthoniobacterales bacterium]|nr:phosphoribosylformylglycinamidine synthase subunit PurL [Chthoniobacterales bacterium]
MKDPVITPEIVERHGITPEEFARIKSILGREPNFTELGIFSVMWSEHCSYKNSRPELKKFPTAGSRILVKAGEENAGVLDVGDGWAVAFKIESHNHPSAIEPFQGAATGVGGIIRDIFTMGARPVFLMDSLRFGPIEQNAPGAAANRHILAGVVSGIAHYGNCIGLPTIGGETWFDETYAGNPLVNVFCLGVLRHDQIARGAARGIGNPVFYVGAETGRDGLAGAAFASRELTEESKQDRPAVQVGDPFREKLLLEACLELLASGAVAGIQDMGAAGLTCSTCETASRGGSGIDVDLDLVPKREEGMSPYEILLSESQERMLVIVHEGQEDRVREIFEKWDLPHACIGRVTGDGLMRIRTGESIVAEIPAASLTDEAPVCHREAAPWTPPAGLDIRTVPPADLTAVLPRLLAHPTLARKRWIWEQYDHMVRNGSVVGPGSDAAVFLARECGKLLAASVDGNSLVTLLDPREGGRRCVAEAARNLACTGAVPLGATDNLNFGNPHKPGIFRQLRDSVEGISEACRAFDTPVTGGNVSLYNENPSGPIDPTPVVAMVGLIEDESHITPQGFRGAGDSIWLLGERSAGLDASQFLLIIHGRKEGRPPQTDLPGEIALHQALRDAIRDGLILSAHDCAEGGLAIALAECCLSGPGPTGAKIALADDGRRDDETLFHEAPGRIIASTDPADDEALADLFSFCRIPAHKIGATGGEELVIGLRSKVYRWPVAGLFHHWDTSLDHILGTVAEPLAAH